jgi:hypothetical protein
MLECLDDKLLMWLSFNRFDGSVSSVSVAQSLPDRWLKVMRNLQQALNQIIHYMWNENTFKEDDLCVVAMLLRLVLYFDSNHSIINELIDYLTHHQQDDGGWNCHLKSKVSSVHTTLSILESYRDLNINKINYKKEIIQKQITLGQSYLLKRELMYRLKDHELIFNAIDKIHFPVRWKYDFFRALEYFASIKYPYESSLRPALDLLKGMFKKGYLGKGLSYKGKLHFKLDSKNLSAMNTLRGLIILKHFDNPFYNEIIHLNIK